MPFLKCPKCGKAVSDRAPQCPSCGFRGNQGTDNIEGIIAKQRNNSFSNEMVKQKPSTEGQALGNLKEHEGAFCLKCDVGYFGQVDACQNCGEPTEPARWYSRLIIERLVFLFVAPAIFASLYVILRDPTTTRDEFGFGGVYLLSGFIIFCAFSAAKTLMDIGGFTERFLEKDLTDQARQVFSINRFFMEFIYFVGVLIALFIVVGIAKLVQWSFSGVH